MRARVMCTIRESENVSENESENESESYVHDWRE